MSDDGAQLGISAQDGMHAALGGTEDPPRKTIGEMVAVIMATDGPSDYSGTSNYAAKLIILWLLEDPQRAQGPTEDVYATKENGEKDYNTVAQAGWYALMKADGVPLGDLGLSGFMWGWAVNAARAAMELPEVPNPAIVTIGGDD